MIFDFQVNHQTSTIELPFILRPPRLFLMKDYFREFSHQHPARRMNCSEDAVRKRIERLRVALRRLWRE
jgi:DNA-directed RNA polymerase specialized sigma24 family protein